MLMLTWYQYNAKALCRATIGNVNTMLKLFAEQQLLVMLMLTWYQYNAKALCRAATIGYIICCRN